MSERPDCDSVECPECGGTGRVPRRTPCSECGETAEFRCGECGRDLCEACLWGDFCFRCAGDDLVAHLLEASLGELEVTT